MSYNKNEVLLTNDGSPTLRSGIFNETYHSLHGAVSESNHVFIKNGLKFKSDPDSKSISVLELGFGTGLNALLSYQFAQQNKISIDYHTLELYPISYEEMESLDFDIGLENASKILKEMHHADWSVPGPITQQFQLTKYKISFEDYTPISTVDIIFHDAFAPSTQAIYWEAAFLKQCYEWLEYDGILVSYCAKGSFKRALKELGFKVESLPGAPGKREMTRAIKNL